MSRTATNQQASNKPAHAEQSNLDEQRAITPQEHRTNWRKIAWVVFWVIVATALLVTQQYVRGSWGLPGHRAIYWLTTLISVRLLTGTPATSTVSGTASAGIITLINPAFALHTLAYIIAGFLVDALASKLRGKPLAAALIVSAPLIACSNLIVSFFSNLQRGGFDMVFKTMAFHAQGHLMWGAAAGIVGVTIGFTGWKLWERFAMHLPPELAPHDPNTPPGRA